MRASHRDDVVEMSALQHVTSTRAHLESALLDVSELTRAEENLAGADITKSMIDMQEKSLHSFLVPPEDNDSKGAVAWTSPELVTAPTDTGEEQTFLQVAEGLDRINMSALDLLAETEPSDNKGVSTAKQTKAKSKKDMERTLRKPSTGGKAAKWPAKGFENAI